MDEPLMSEGPTQGGTHSQQLKAIDGFLSPQNEEDAARFA